MGFEGGRLALSKGRACAVLVAFAVVLIVVLLTADLAWAQTPPTDANLSITKSGPARVEPGQNFNYVLTVSNAAGAAPAENVQVTDNLPAGVTLVEARGPGCSATGTDRVTCTIPTLAAGESRTITLTVRSDTIGEITNQASARADNQPDSPVNSNRVTTRVAPELEINKMDDTDPVTDTQDLLLYTLRVQNVGDFLASGVAVTDDLPLAQVDLVTFDSNDFDCEYTAGLLQCNARESLSPGEVAKVEVVVEPEVAGTIRNAGAAFGCGPGGCILVDSDIETTRVQGATDDGTDDGVDDGNGDGNNNDDGNSSDDGSTGDDEGTNNAADADGNASAGGVDLTCEQLIRLVEEGDAEAAQYSTEVSQRCEGSANVIAGTVPDKTLADTGGPSFGLLVASLFMVGGGLLLRASLRR